MESQAQTSIIRHRRETLIQLVLPMLLLALLVAAGVVLVVLLPRGLQVGIVSDLMFAVLILCPAALCLLPLTILMVTAAVGMNHAHDALAQPLRKVEGHSASMVARTQTAADQVNHTTVNLSARLGFLYRWMSIFEQTSEKEENNPQ
ncbi:MAG: hypothetical protein K8J31_30695 [Anaerolineae bacterium]|nr:hypothetical protein [Anaerolineae bacterium]